ncbi:MAG: HupE/UreJ family protein [Bacteroidetes bacterium]|nr:HupE/UreJ family protein [Bacteroidota bacterium]
MTDFYLWFSSGFEHIVSIDGYDHIMFVALLVFTFSIKNWSKLLVLITAFTVGHSVSLVLSAYEKINLNQNVVEILIGFSIVVTAAYHLLNFRKPMYNNAAFLYFIVLFFGLIHGLGFSYFLKSMLGHSSNVLFPLLYFNLGIEVAQLFVVIIVLIFSLFLGFAFKIPYQLFKFISICAICISSIIFTITRFIDYL